MRGASSYCWRFCAIRLPHLLSPLTFFFCVTKERWSAAGAKGQTEPLVEGSKPRKSEFIIPACLPAAGLIPETLRLVAKRPYRAGAAAVAHLTFCLLIFSSLSLSLHPFCLLSIARPVVTTLLLAPFI